MERAASHADAWFGGDLWHEGLADMSAAGGAYWLTVLAWTLAALTAVDAVVQPFTTWPVLLGASIMLLVGARRVERPVVAQEQVVGS